MVAACDSQEEARSLDDRTPEVEGQWMRSAGSFDVTVGIEGGYARVKWEPYDGGEEVQAYWVDIQRPGVPSEGVEVEEPLGNWWVDSAYVAGPTHYTVKVKLAGGGAASASVTANFPMPQVVEHTFDEAGGTVVTWTSSGPIRTRNARYRSGPPREWRDLASSAEIESADDTSVLILNSISSVARCYGYRRPHDSP